jgi:hypothetical protein
MSHFYCKIGEIETTQRWFGPTPQSVYDWYQEWKLTPGIEKYPTYFMGNFAEGQFGPSNLRTGDMDVMLTGDITNNIELNNLMSEAIRIGFEHRLLIDIMHMSHISDFVEFQPFTQTRAWGHYRKEIDEKVSEFSFANLPNTIEVEGPLWMCHKETKEDSRSWIKANERVLDGTYSGLNITPEDAIQIWVDRGDITIT